MVDLASIQWRLDELAHRGYSNEIDGLRDIVGELLADRATVRSCLETNYDGLVENAMHVTCREADAWFQALLAVGMYDEADRFMCWHAFHDDDGDHHGVCLFDEDGQPIGWHRREVKG